MSVTLPNEEQLADVADRLGFNLSPEDVKSFQGLMQGYVDAYNAVDLMIDPIPEITYPRTVGVRPPVEENELNAWYVKSTVEGAPEGKLKGKTVVLKDNVMLGGVPMMNGSSTLEGYVPNVDATIVTRMLDAGATIVGKAHCECFCMSGGSHTSAQGPVCNPHDPTRSAGGSSSGSAALVSKGEVDMAIGGDQGGSIRMPSAFCGTVGMKPTHGLVPYTGIVPIEITIDHAGPITSTVADNALLLEVLAGSDGYDSRQIDISVSEYTEGLDKPVKGMKVAILKEGFGHATSQPESDEKVREAAKKLEALGVTVEEVSIPMHLLAPAIWAPIGLQGLTQTMMLGDGYGTSRPDLYVTSFMDFHRGWRERADELSETLKLAMLFAQYCDDEYGKRFFGKAFNLTKPLKAAYDAVLADYDAILMPTVPMTATPLPGPDASREEIVERAFEMLNNTSAFDITHHPALSVPCGKVDGLPVGMMLVGKMWDEKTLYTLGDAFEKSGDWTSW
ncbi:MAG: Asp-tRNA(Asn)/Glu-tRNA(Gln) amidotransferase GatCAB subunit A [Rhodobacteraceae bacterium]|jgi:amidase|uniref:Amidase n=1 Tax=Salipiger profundus TaxID=1229727 RepID=A0A1U7D8J9_9RHOB|nr:MULTISPECIES: amidase [Salipiger]APX24390.1 amidase [Salipiger profundus]MAB07308.1 Asp-tRNA(Asn)/Glu-tRNA(Gln) amidotransferase GatCAB subunit A [Paracoccaceae bacterium]GGA19613.1 amidase [Salipiger profundus]SFD37303.1 amidase [Salipiger profundus]